MFRSNYLANPIVQSIPSDTLTNCSDCLTYLSETAVCLKEEEISHAAYLGLQSLLECVRTAIDYENQRLAHFENDLTEQ